MSEELTGVFDVELSRIRENSFNPNAVSEEKLKALEESLNSDGQLQPVILRQLDKGFEEDQTYEYELIDGEHRFRLAEKLGWKTIRAEIRVVNDVTAMRMCYKLNEARGSLDVFKQGLFFSLLKKKGLLETAEKDYGVSKTFVEERMLLNSINEEQRELLLKATRKMQVLEPHFWVEYAKLSPEERVVFCKGLKGNDEPISFRDFQWIAKSVRKDVSDRKKFEELVKSTEFKFCPTCKKPARSLGYEPGELRCEKYHTWNAKTGKTAQQTVSGDYDEKKDKPKQRYPRQFLTDLPYEDAAETAQKKILAMLDEIRSISFRDKNGTLWSVDFEEDAKRVSITRGDKQYHGFDKYYLQDKDGKVKMWIPRNDTATKKNNEQALDWLKWLGGKVIQPPAKKKKKG